MRPILPAPAFFLERLATVVWAHVGAQSLLGDAVVLERAVEELPEADAEKEVAVVEGLAVVEVVVVEVEAGSDCFINDVGPFGLFGLRFGVWTDC